MPQFWTTCFNNHSTVVQWSRSICLKNPFWTTLFKTKHQTVVQYKTPNGRAMVHGNVNRLFQRFGYWWGVCVKWLMDSWRSRRAVPHTNSTHGDFVVNLSTDNRTPHNTARRLRRKSINRQRNAHMDRTNRTPHTPCGCGAVSSGTAPNT
jgi:hypothetical protein